MGNSCACCPCCHRAGYEDLPGDNDPGDGEAWSSPCTAPGVAAATEPQDRGLPAPNEGEIPTVFVQQPGVPGESEQAPSSGPSPGPSLGTPNLAPPQGPSTGGPPPPPPALPPAAPPPPPPPPPLPGTADAMTVARPPWLKEKKAYNKEGATLRVACRKIAASDIEVSSLWGSASEGRFANAGLKNQLLLAFPAKKSLAVPSRSSAAVPLPSPPRSPTEGAVFSTGLLRNLDILRKTARVSDKDLKMAILSGDLAALSAVTSIKDLIVTLLKVNTEQTKRLKEMQASGAALQEAEWFFVQLVDEGHLSERLRCLEFHFARAELLGETARQQGLVLAALVAAASSRGLAELAQLLLFILNFLNEDASSAPAYGFNLCDIDKVSSIKMTNPTESGSLLDLVARECQSSYPNILNVITELEPIAQAAKVDCKNLKSMIRSLRVDVTNVESDLRALPDSEPHSAFSKAMLEWKRKVAQLENGEPDVEAAWDKLRVKFSLKGEIPSELFSSLATFRHDFKKLTAKKVTRLSIRRNKSCSDLFPAGSATAP